MDTRAPTLLELQRMFRLDLLHPGDGDAASYIVPDGVSPDARLAVYRNTITSTLLRALTLSYPAVRALVGAEFFEGAARLFVEQHPPASALLDSYGALLPDYLAQMPQASSLVYLPDTARLEWMVNEVLHAPDEAPVDLRRLQRLNNDGLGDVRVRPGAALRLLPSDFPVDSIWRAVLDGDDAALANINLDNRLDGDDAALANINLDNSRVWLLVCRNASGVEVRRIAQWQWRFVSVLSAGCPLHEALAVAPDDEAHIWLAFLLASGGLTVASMANQDASH